VDLVADFHMVHMDVEVEEAQARRSSSALVSAREHVIRFDVVTCLDTATPTATAPLPESTTPPEPHPAANRYLGNSRNRELHDLNKLKPQCLVNAIDVDRRYYFATISEALALNYDFCAYCFGKGASRR